MADAYSRIARVHFAMRHQPKKRDVETNFMALATMTILLRACAAEQRSAHCDGHTLSAAVKRAYTFALFVGTHLNSNRVSF